MSRVGAPTVFVGNDFILPKKSTSVIQPVIEVVEPALTPALAMPQQSFVPALATHKLSFEPTALPRLLFELFHRYTIITFAILLLIVGSTGVNVAGNYQAARIEASAKPLLSLRAKAPAITGLNSTVPAADMAATLQRVTGQAATLTVGDQAEPISPDVIKSWLQITPSANKSENYIHVKADTIAQSLTELASKHAKTPVDQVTATHPDGSSLVIVTGKNGATLTDPGSLKIQAVQIAKTLMDSKGLQASTPLATVPFAAVTPAVFGKLLEVNVNSKQMWAWENGVITRTFPISAGAPQTPTPIGQFKIYSKLPVQDMKGFNADGTKYFQPHVRWINYFLPGGYAVHGNYWRAQSWFGNINSSHGCVSLPDVDAKWVYDFAPLGTTVITHH
ncbi:MAG: hypothetical protein JWO35_474 [Candidatus Saccharibacteria bacterium]|nr:hypothetical protein [Candidatus Saccharibacteria bacterium]